MQPFAGILATGRGRFTLSVCMLLAGAGAVVVGATAVTGAMCLALVVFPGTLPLWSLYVIAFCMTTGDCAAVGVISLLREVVPAGQFRLRIDVHWRQYGIRFRQSCWDGASL